MSGKENGAGMAVLPGKKPFRTRYERSNAAVTLVADLRTRMQESKPTRDAVDVLTSVIVLLAAPVEIRKANQRILVDLVEGAKKRTGVRR
jgi:hypothetical protein